ncbi:uncharacterized protein Dvir_GJ12094 [Drosophila virilis]|uniref:Uncharacterized protein n=1 Tax=Drosophila virilis TaxID=7244 RepID=A0A0Q9WIT6_DROVI|nr:uncharacterized protein LOC6623750 isoform X2 [Drosophila virilis]KRF84419.1 uncharacterized protein Dvir_GJ12094 [Drosophila virilis]
MASTSKMDDKLSTKRKRKTEPKKWSEREVNDILNYMRVHRNIEKPTAQIYYRKLIDESKLDATWNLVRFKVKGGWQKADAHRKSIMAGEEDGDEIDDTTLRAKLEMEVVGRESLESRSSLDMLHCEDESTTEPLFTSGIEDLSQVASMDANRRKFQEDRLWVERETLKLQQEQFLWAKEVEERKMRLEEQQFKLEERRIALEEQRREADFQLKQLELELKYFFSLKAFH